MTEHHCRVRRFRLKDGGAEVAQLRPPSAGKIAEMHEAVRDIARMDREAPTSWAVVAFWDDASFKGYYSMGASIFRPLARAFPDAVRNAIEREMNAASDRNDPRWPDAS